jgi:hypothetical protein
MTGIPLAGMSDELLTEDRLVESHFLRQSLELRVGLQWSTCFFALILAQRRRCAAAILALAALLIFRFRGAPLYTPANALSAASIPDS